MARPQPPKTTKELVWELHRCRRSLATMLEDKSAIPAVVSLMQQRVDKLESELATRV
jgi:hypothetical protein